MSLGENSTVGQYLPSERLSSCWRNKTRIEKTVHEKIWLHTKGAPKRPELRAITLLEGGHGIVAE